jgi:hypothetical protein
MDILLLCNKPIAEDALIYLPDAPGHRPAPEYGKEILMDDNKYKNFVCRINLGAS